MSTIEIALAVATLADAALLLFNFRLIAHAGKRNKELLEVKKYLTATLENRARITEQLREANRQLDEMKIGWFPATYNNCRGNHAARFKFRGKSESIKEPIKHYTTYGPVFRDRGLVSFDNLLIKLNVS